MKTRIISGAVLTVILVGAVLGGGTTMFILAAIITALGLYELYKVVGIEKKALGICGYILAASFYTMLWFDKLQYLEYFCVASGILTMFVYVCSFKTTRAKQAAFSLLGIYYVAIPISYIYNRSHKNHTVKSVKYSSMSRNKIAVIFNVIISFNCGCSQISEY